MSDNFSDYLEHYGVKGMKWGIRRSRHEESKAKRRTRSDTERRRRIFRRFGTGAAVGAGAAASVAGMKRAKAAGAFESSIKTKNGNISPAEKAVRSTKDISYDSGRLVRNMGDVRRNNSSEYRNYKDEMNRMSDKELREYINRKNLEKSYMSLRSDEIEDGYRKTERVLSMVGDVAAIGLSAATLAATIQGMRKNK